MGGIFERGNGRRVQFFHVLLRPISNLLDSKYGQKYDDSNGRYPSTPISPIIPHVTDTRLQTKLYILETNTNNIFAKRQASNRTQAVTHARELHSI